MRLFLAINLPPNIKDALSKELPRFFYLKFRQIPKENWHITLKFIGEAEELVLPIIKESAQAVVAHFKRFNLSLQDFGFLNRRIFAVNLKRSPKLYALFKMIDERLGACQVAPCEGRRFFNPHITVGRKNPPFSGQLHSVRHFDLKMREPISFTVNSVDLMQSRLMPEGSLYRVVEKYSLLVKSLKCKI